MIETGFSFFQGMDILENMRQKHKKFTIRLCFYNGKYLTLMQFGGPVFSINASGQLVMLKPQRYTELPKKCNAIGIDCFLTLNAGMTSISRICLLNRPCSSRCGLMISAKDGQFVVRGIDDWTRDAEAYPMIARKPL